MGPFDSSGFPGVLVILGHIVTSDTMSRVFQSKTPSGPIVPSILVPIPEKVETQTIFREHLRLKNE